MNLFRIFLTVAALMAGLGVAAGAFASHALKAQLSERMLAIFETGVRYQMYHALALLAVALLLQNTDLGRSWLTAAGWAFVTGIVIFSGSLYGLSLSGVKVLGAITPIGGVAFILGWGCLVMAGLSLKY